MFRALRVKKNGDTPSAPIEVEMAELTDADLMPGDVTIDVEYSSINFKDGLALAGKPGVIKQYPLIPGIDLVGTVAESESSDYRPGDRVILNGWGIGETHHGGLAERARVKSDWLVPLPNGLSAKEAAAIGTAGFTAMLAVLALERFGAISTRSLRRPRSGRLEGVAGGVPFESLRERGSASGVSEAGASRASASGTASATAGDVLVTGASGGVGSIAVAILAGLGHRVVASTGRPEESEYLRSLGAAEIIDRATLSEPGKPLQGQRWAAAIDSVGGHTLANVLAQTSYGGIVASCGLAQSGDLPTTVMPFILRSVTLTGINSVQAPHELRLEAWARLRTDLDLELLEQLTTTIALADATAIAEKILAGQVRGRTVVDVRASTLNAKSSITSSGEPPQRW
jgi:acrylyl-CoA reductase (NADPH)